MENKVESMLEEWLQGVQGRICFKEVMKVYAPTCDGQCEDAVQELADNLSKAFGGATIYEKATGEWFDNEENRIIKEPVKVIELAHSCADPQQLRTISTLITQYALKTNQKAVSVQNGRFYIAETPDILDRWLRESYKFEEVG